MPVGLLPSTRYPRDGEWTPYGTCEGLPLIDATHTTPTVKHSDAGYLVQGDMCSFYIRIAFATGGAGSGAYAFLAPPVNIPYSTSFNVGTIAVGSFTASQGPFGVKNVTYPLAYADVLVTPRIPNGRHLIVFPSPTNSYLPPGGTATVANGTTSVTVAHGAALVPDSVVVAPLRDWQQPTTGDMVRYWVDNITATTFKLNAVVEGTGINYGSTAVTSGQTTKVVTHGFTTAPNSFVITPTTQLSSVGVSEMWISATGATTATVSVNAAPSSNLNFNWLAKRGGFEPSAAVTADFPVSWQAIGPSVGTDNAGIFVTDSFPWAWTTNDRIDIMGTFPLRTVPTTLL